MENSQEVSDLSKDKLESFVTVGVYSIHISPNAQYGVPEPLIFFGKKVHLLFTCLKGFFLKVEVKHAIFLGVCCKIFTCFYNTKIFGCILSTCLSLATVGTLYLLRTGVLIIYCAGGGLKVDLLHFFGQTLEYQVLIKKSDICIHDWTHLGQRLQSNTSCTRPTKT